MVLEGLFEVALEGKSEMRLESQVALEGKSEMRLESRRRVLQARGTAHAKGDLCLQRP